MAEFRGIPIVTTGSKYQTEQGFAAIKNGVKARDDRSAVPREAKPPWLKARIPSGERYEKLRDTVRAHRLATVCEESMCPNIGECWNNGTATIMLMGHVCTRACQFCAVDTGNPHGWLDPEEVQNSARSVQLMNLKYVVLTSVDRDDLPDGGARHYADCIRAIKDLCPDTAVEALTPDFSGRFDDVATVVDSGLEVFAQNVETVRRLTHKVRDARAGYDQTLGVLAFAKRHRPAVLTKSSLMLGLGETDEEIIEALDDLRAANVDIVTFGQYLRPTPNHLAVERYVTPEQFQTYREWGLARGFLEVVSGALVRSSYRADRVFDKNNAGLSGA
jgi:lipoic acid synthetase